MTLGDIDGCLVLGAGGHAKVVIDALQVSGITSKIAALDGDPASVGRDIFGVPVRGGDEFLAKAGDDGFSHFIVGFAGAAAGKRRGDAYQRGVAAGLVPLTVIHPAATVSSHARIGAGSVVLAGAVINPDAAIGDNVIINTSAVVEHDCMVGSHAHIAPGAFLLGNVAVGDFAFIGTGAVINPGISIGPGATVGSGGVVIRDVAPETTVVGVPAATMK